MSVRHRTFCPSCKTTCLKLLIRDEVSVFARVSGHAQITRGLVLFRDRRMSLSNEACELQNRKP